MAFLKGVLYGFFLGAGPTYLLLVCLFRYAHQFLATAGAGEGQGVGMAVLLSDALTSQYLWGVVLGAGVLAPATVLALWMCRYVRL